MNPVSSFHPNPVRPAPFNFFRTSILDHRGRRMPWRSKHNNDAPGKPKSSRSKPERREPFSKHDFRVSVFILVPLLLLLAAIQPFTRLASFAAKHLLPQYFGETHRDHNDTLIRIAIVVAFYWLAAALAWIAIWAWYHKMLIPELAHAMLRRGQCASCSYPIADLNPTPDGCTICPECGAAWKLNASTSKRAAV